MLVTAPDKLPQVYMVYPIFPGSRYQFRGGGGVQRTVDDTALLL